MPFNNLHTEEISFFQYQSPTQPVISGYEQTGSQLRSIFNLPSCQSTCSVLPVHQHLKPPYKLAWSQISMDFVTGLPTSEGNTVILTIVDRFSMMVHVSCFSSKIAICQGDSRSNPAPSRVSRPTVHLPFSEGILQPDGATVSLSSGYHPQSNRQPKRLNYELGRDSGALCLRPQLSGARICFEFNLLIILCLLFPQECPLSRACMDTNCLCFRPWRERSVCWLQLLWSGGAIEHGSRCGTFCSRPLPFIRLWVTVTAPPFYLVE